MAHGGGFTGQRAPNPLGIRAINPNGQILVRPEQYVMSRGRGCLGFVTPAATTNVRQRLESSLDAQLNESLFNPGGGLGTTGRQSTRRPTVTFRPIDGPVVEVEKIRKRQI